MSLGMKFKKGFQIKVCTKRGITKLIRSKVFSGQNFCISLITLKNAVKITNKTFYVLN